MTELQKLRWVFSFFMSLLMSALMSGWVTLIVAGQNGHFFQNWGHAFLAAWPAAFTIVILFAPTVQRFSYWLITKPQ